MDGDDIKLATIMQFDLNRTRFTDHMQIGRNQTLARQNETRPQPLPLAIAPCKRHDHNRFLGLESQFLNRFVFW